LCVEKHWFCLYMSCFPSVHLDHQNKRGLFFSAGACYIVIWHGLEVRTYILSYLSSHGICILFHKSGNGSVPISFCIVYDISVSLYVKVIVSRRIKLRSRNICFIYLLRWKCHFRLPWTLYKNKNRLAALNFQEKSMRNYKVSWLPKN
jgi:hypothetical protein